MDTIAKYILLVLTLFAFWVSLDLMSVSVSVLTHDATYGVMESASFPLLGFFIGLLATAVIQSSSTITSMVIAMVASGALSISSSIPIILGANLGTTFTAVIISMGYLTRKKEYRRASSLANAHFVFNFLTCLIVIPLEFGFSLLSNIAIYLSSLLSSFWSINSSNQSIFSILFDFFHPLSFKIIHILGNSAVVALILAAISLFSSVYFLSHTMRKMLFGDLSKLIRNHLFGKPFKSGLWGTGITAVVQSSSVVTATVIPLATLNQISVQRVYPFLVGANIGTTITALLAAIYQSEVAISVALMHLFFNLLGLLVFFLTPVLKELPVYLAQLISSFSEKRPILGLIFPAFFYFIVPAIAIYLLQL